MLLGQLNNDVRINNHLSMLLTSMVIHSYLPDNLMRTIIVPVVKDKCGNVTDKDNYHPIALTTVISKVLELLILDKIELELYTCVYQFVSSQNTELICVLLYSLDFCNTIYLSSLLDYLCSGILLSSV